jgi:chromosomal replication initiator protein
MPNHITSLDKIISNRFACGLSADIKPPGEELKIAILHHKASAKGMELETSLAQFLARQTDGNIRSLEGYLTKLSAISEIHDREINLELAAEIIEPITNNHKITLDDIIDLVAKHFAVSAEEIKSSKKNREITHPRQIAMYLSRKFTDHSFLEIGCSFGNKDHSTVLKGFKKIKTLIRNSDQGSEEIIRLENYITEGKYIKK